ncbi:MAG: carboxypeptidase-like regulatory domain-containing protein [Bryobacteraceae bacterium]
MMFCSRRLLLFFAASCLFPSIRSDGQSGNYAITGTVVERGSNRPLNHVLVTISPAEHRDLEVSYLTASDGRFAFTNLVAAKYSLEAQRRGDPPEGYRQNESYGTAIATGPGLDSENIVFPLDAPGSISGTVVDQEGDPVREVQLWLFHKGVFNGRFEVSLQTMRRSDSSGAFHCGHLRPGAYFIAAQARPWYARNVFPPQEPEGEQNPARSELDVAYPVTYYGDSVEAESAAPITISEGGSAKVQITLRAVPAVHVTLAGNERESDQTSHATLFSPGPGGFLIPLHSIMSGRMNDRQQLMGVAPGHYVVAIQSFGHGVLHQSGRKTVDLSGNTTLDLSEVPKTSLAGQVSFEGSERPSGPAFVQFSCAAAGNNCQSFGAGVENDGTLDASNTHFAPARYEVQIANVPGFYVKSVTAKGATASGTTIDIPESASVQLTIVAAKGLTRVDGTALRDGKPFAGAMVLLVPEDLSRMGSIRRDQSDSDGTFTLNEVIPGRYRLVAIDDGRDLAYQDPEVIKPYLSGADPLNVSMTSLAGIKVEVETRR